MAFITQNAQLQISAGLAKQFPTNPIPQVAFSGRSNVGKSSLLNTLLGRKSLARVSSAPGKTITVNFYNVNGIIAQICKGCVPASQVVKIHSETNFLTQLYIIRCGFSVFFNSVFGNLNSYL